MPALVHITLSMVSNLFTPIGWRDDVCTTRSFQAYNLSWDKNLRRLWGRPVDGRWTNLGDEVHIACMLWPGKRMNCFITYNFLRNINELIHIYVSIRISVSFNKTISIYVSWTAVALSMKVDLCLRIDVYGLRQDRVMCLRQDCEHNTENSSGRTGVIWIFYPHNSTCSTSHRWRSGPVHVIKLNVSLIYKS